MNVKHLIETLNYTDEQREILRNIDKTFDYTPFDNLVRAYRNRATINETTQSIMDIIGEDKGSLKFLCVVMYGACAVYEEYQKNGVSDDIFYDTMNCLPRFCKECKIRTGEIGFDREWWVPRQLGFHEFRIGELEYEVIYDESNLPNKISIHIPSDADMTMENLHKSVSDAKAFIAKHFPALKDAPYICCTWLFCKELREMLPPTSKILNFQSIFDLSPTEAKAVGALRYWLFHTDDEDLTHLCEDTSLQRKMKAHLLAGNEPIEYCGVLKI